MLCVGVFVVCVGLYSWRWCRDYIYTHTRTHACLFRGLRLSSGRGYTHAYIHTYEHAHMHVHSGASNELSGRGYTHTQIHTYMQTYVHTNIHTYPFNELKDSRIIFRAGHTHTYIHTFSLVAQPILGWIITTCIRTYIHTHSGAQRILRWILRTRLCPIRRDPAAATWWDRLLAGQGHQHWPRPLLQDLNNTEWAELKPFWLANSRRRFSCLEWRVWETYMVLQTAVNVIFDGFSFSLFGQLKCNKL